jgi:tetratricopeptide (TPR) repeat protein
VASGDLQAARAYFEDGLQIRRLLAEADPSSAEKQRDLSISFNKLGEVSVASGDLQSARAYFEDGLGIRRLLAEADPSSAQKQRDIAVSYSKIATYQEKASLHEAVENWQKCLDVFDGMIAGGLHVSPQDIRFLERLRQKFA